MVKKFDHVAKCHSCTFLLVFVCRSTPKHALPKYRCPLFTMSNWNMHVYRIKIIQKRLYRYIKAKTRVSPLWTIFRLLWLTPKGRLMMLWCWWRGGRPCGALLEHPMHLHGAQGFLNLNSGKGKGTGRWRVPGPLSLSLLDLPPARLPPCLPARTKHNNPLGLGGGGAWL